MTREQGEAAPNVPVPHVLVTGGAGFFGDVFKRSILEKGWSCVSLDVIPDAFTHPNLTAVAGDVRDRRFLDRLAEEHHFSAVFHFAAMLAHEVKDEDVLWSTNVEGTRNIADMAARHSIGKIVFTSTNCLWGEGFNRPVLETDDARPVEVYGRSKLAAERILLGRDDCQSVILRCPTIVDSGRLGLLSILFEFIEAGKRVWVVGDGTDRHQMVSARDLVEACILAMEHDGTEVFNVGSDDVKPIRDVYQYVIDQAGTGARVARLPRRATLGLMKLAHVLGLSPLGPYQYKMIAESFVFDTSKIKRELSWKPTLTDDEMLYAAYRFYCDGVGEPGPSMSAHRRNAPMGAIRILKWLS